jgi:hypothetical protein
MTISRFIALGLVAVVLGTFGPPKLAAADGAASTRNILIGGAAATLLIINHNKKVHQQYAADADKEASLAQARNDAQAAYVAEKKAYQNEAKLVADLQREIAYQHDVVDQLKQQVSESGGSAGSDVAMRSSPDFAAPTTLVVPTAVGGQRPVSVTSYGWGTI